MGSGTRVTIFRNRGGLWFGLALDNMPFRYTIGIGLGLHIVQLGLGKAYDRHDTGTLL